MKAGLAPQPHLAVVELSLLPSEEWLPRFTGWAVVYVMSGVGYWMQPSSNVEIGSGAVAVLNEGAAGVLRASQIGELTIHHYAVHPDRLNGVLTLGNLQSLKQAARRKDLAFRVFPCDTTMADGFRLVLEHHRDWSQLRLRLRLLELFVASLDRALETERPPQEREAHTRARLEQYLKEMPASDLVHLDFGDLVERMGCSPRNVARVFKQITGLTFRNRQVEVRLSRALELLETTDSNIQDVAAESGYKSLSLFDLLFKRRYGVPPSTWRINVRKAGASAQIGEIKETPIGKNS